MIHTSSPIFQIVLLVEIEKATKGIAAADAVSGEDGALEKTILFVGLHGVFTTCGYIAAASGKKGRNLGCLEEKGRWV